MTVSLLWILSPISISFSLFFSRYHGRKNEAPYLYCHRNLKVLALLCCICWGSDPVNWHDYEWYSKEIGYKSFYFFRCITILLSFLFTKHIGLSMERYGWMAGSVMRDYPHRELLYPEGTCTKGGSFNNWGYVFENDMCLPRKTLWNPYP